MHTPLSFGSLAKGSDHARSDIDLMVISDALPRHCLLNGVLSTRPHGT
jgi:predicted nucleotidyltransferase